MSAEALFDEDFGVDRVDQLDLWGQSTINNSQLEITPGSHSLALVDGAGVVVEEQSWIDYNDSSKRQNRKGG